MALDDPEKRAELAQLERETDLRKLLSSREGRRFFWRLLDQVTGINRSSFAADAWNTAHAEGRRSVGLELQLEAQRVDRPGYIAMMGEALEEAARAALLEQNDRDEKEAE